jgi:methyltransferase (TIGR00027 family)
MTDRQAGLSALAMAYARAHHATYDSPKIFDDFLAASLFTQEELAERDRTWAGLLQYVAPELAAANPDPATATAWVIQLTNGPITLPRSRYAEDSLAESIRQGIRQYVILGAGFDTFAYRRPDLANRLQIFELDHPATQAIKRERVAAAGWAHPANLHFVPVDFTGESLAVALERSPYRADQPSFFSWMGVSFYLAREVILDTLRSIASTAAPGSTVVFDYLHTDAYDPEKAGKRMQQMQYMAAQLGEPMKSGFDPRTLAAELEALGLRLEENLDPAAIEARYFQGRTDRYHAIEHFHYAEAVVI